MDKKINKKAEDYVVAFKNSIAEELKTLTHNGDTSMEEINNMIKSVYEYPRLVFEKHDFTKRKRQRNTIDKENQCTALKADGEQCTRRKLKNFEFCGTHSKDAPHGLKGDQKQTVKKVEIYTENIKGIIYYIDHVENIYKMEDILQEVENPRIIGKYVKDEHGIHIKEIF